VVAWTRWGRGLTVLVQFSQARWTPAAGAEEAVDRDDVTSAGLTAIGIVAGTVARAVAIGGRLVAVGLGTLENVLRGVDEHPAGSSESRPSPASRRSDEQWAEGDEDGDAGFAPLPGPALEPADGVTPPKRPARSAIRRSSAEAAARTAASPRPAKRATAKSLPPNLRPVEPQEQAPEPAPVKGAAGAADVAGVKPAAAKKTAAKKAAKKAPAKKATPAESAATKATPAESAATKATPAESPSPPAASPDAADQAPATDSAASAATRPEGTPEA